LRREGRLAECLEALDRGLVVCPEAEELLIRRGNVLKDLGRLEEALAAFRQALIVDPGLASARSNMIFTMKYMPDATSSEIMAEAEAFGAAVRAKAKPFTQWNVSREPDRRLRVGMVSGDFRSHVVGYYLRSFLGQLDRGRVELVAYSNCAIEDETTAQFKPHFALWRQVHGLSDKKLAARIHEDQVDILIDLSGHSGRNRLPMFAFKPAPVQASWLGLFVTTGVQEMDYIIADPHLLADEEEQYFTEKVWPLAESWFCLSPPALDVEPGPLPALSTGVVTFGCFNNLSKVSDRAVSTWARILREVPGSRLFLKTKQLQDSSACDAILGRFKSHGIGPERLLLEGRSPRQEYFAAYQRVDISLDPFPYHGATTSLDGLWMGVPMVTCRGTRVGSHLGESIAHAAGLADWIAEDEGAYVEIAKEKASDLEALSALRAGLRTQVLGTSLFDGARFARQFEDALRGMWRKFAECAG
jgi:predicted O-linked N-acetylglucosamine transferase (SPINDLY family)